MDFILICFIIVYNVLAFLINLRILYIFEDKDDSRGFLKETIFSRLLILIGLQLLWLNFILVPISILNKYPIIGNQNLRTVNVGIFFNFILVTNILFISLLLPFSMFHYETQFDTKIGLNRSYTPYLFTIIVLVIIWTLIGGNYGVFREIIINHISDLTCNELINLGFVSSAECTNNKLYVNGSFFISTTSLFLFVGYIYNIIFVGIGCILVPLYLIYIFQKRPKKLSKDEYKCKIAEILEISKSLSIKGEELKKKYENCLENKNDNIFSSSYILSINEKRNIKNKIRKYEKEVISLNAYLENIEFGYNNKSEDYMYLIAISVLLFFSLLLSLSLFIIFIINLIIDSNKIINYSGNQFINLLFIIFSIIFPIYLGICVCFTWNILAQKVCYCFPLHIMAKSKTPLNSMIFNIGIVLFSTINIIYITNLSSSWLFKSDLYYLFLLASNTKLNYKCIPNHILVYSLFGVSISTLIIYFTSFIWDNGIKISQEMPKILTRYTKSNK
ncbi:hypothetical protein FG386_002751 [Cryptosporidium ryanae]|uniref:uncharacterized protein n=1 Tax=Cryptosporidium ryanae TaxID=515981 RepID=UPI00351AAF19|nr:hypothetical protein FG386_002751 [Cryptosporidium ryanae]